MSIYLIERKQKKICMLWLIFLSKFKLTGWDGEDALRVVLPVTFYCTIKYQISTILQLLFPKELQNNGERVPCLKSILIFKCPDICPISLM